MEIILISLLTLGASIVGTVTGFGMSTIMVPVLAMVLPPIEAIFLVAIVHFFGDTWKVLLFRKGFFGKLVLVFGVIGIAGSYVGASLSLAVSQTTLVRIFGLFLVAYAGFLLYQPRFKIPAGAGAAVAGGALSGFFAGLFGIGGAVRGVFLSAFDLPKAAYIAASGAIGIMTDSIRIATYASGGVTLPMRFWWSLLILIPISFVGAEIAKVVVDRIPQKKFRVMITLFLLIIGIKFVVFP